MPNTHKTPYHAEYCKQFRYILLIFYTLFKERAEKTLTNKRKAQICTVAIAAIAVLGGLSFQQYRKAENSNAQLTYTYQRAVSDLSGYVSGMKTALEKARYANTPTMQNGIAARLLKESSGAKAAMACLPLSGENEKTISKFLSQAGDYASSLSRKLASGEKLTDKEYATLVSLQKYAGILNKELQGLESRLNDGSITLSKSKSQIKNTASALPVFSGELEKNAEAFHDYPTLLYDGPFSDHIGQRQALAVKNLAEVPQGNAQQAAAKFLNTPINDWKHVSDTKGGLPCYNFVKGKTRISITKRGGIPALLQNPRTITKQNLDFAKARDKAEAFLKKVGMTPMKESYYVISDGICTINFAYQSGKITCYPDLVKVGVALDNGEIVQYNATGYLMNHHERTFEKTKLSLEEAKKKVSPRLKIKKSSLALIPTPGMHEVLCYEFLCSGENKENVLVYINTQNGMEAQILILLQSDNGILAI